MGHSHDPNFIADHLIEDVIGKPAKDIATLRLAENCAKFRISQEVGARPLKFSEKCKPEIGVRACGVEDCGIVQLGKRDWNDDQLSRQLGTNLSQRLSNRHNLHCTALDLGNSAIELGSPGLLNLRIIFQARQQPLGQRCAFARGELQRF